MIATFLCTGTQMAKIALIVGSVRHDRQGIKVARWMEQKLIDRNHVVFFIDPIEINNINKLDP